MTTTKTKLADPIAELGAVLPGEALERLADLLADPGADHSLGQLARIGAALSDIGSQLTTEAREGMYDRLAGGVGESGRTVQYGVLFQWRAPHEQTALDTRKMRALYPRDEHPDLYTTRQVKGSVSITMLEAE